MSPATRKATFFAIFLLACVAAGWSSVRALVQLALSEDTYSHILLVPFITVTLLWMNRGDKKLWNGSNPGAAMPLFLVGVALLLFGARLGAMVPGDDPLGLAILGLVLLIWAGVLFFFGTGAFRAYLFPFLFLLLLVPVPKVMIDGLVEWLRQGSALATEVFFRVTRTPVLREGFVFTVPGAAIDIAPECSGIRSALAMLITCLLAGYLFLRTAWARLILLVATVPMLVIKNGIRIVTLTLLATHVDQSFLTGDLHRKGGFVFFLIGLLILWPVLLWLQSAEKKMAARDGVPARPVSASPA